MSAGNVDQIVRIPGKLCHTPTTLSGSFPFGGTAIGHVRQIALRLEQRSSEVHAEEWDETAEVVQGALRVKGMACVIRQFDADAVSWIFPSVATVSSDKVVNIPGSALPGALGSDRAKKLLFAPDNADHEAILLYAAIPTFADDGVELQRSIFAERAIPVLFRPVRSNSKVGQIAKLSRLTLTP